MENKKIVKNYDNGEITVVWQPALCVHSGNCVRNLAKVFQPKDKPWIKMENASSEEIRMAVGHCPSGALSIQEKKS